MHVCRTAMDADATVSSSGLGAKPDAAAVRQDMASGEEASSQIYPLTLVAARRSVPLTIRSPATREHLAARAGLFGWSLDWFHGRRQIRETASSAGSAKPSAICSFIRSP